MAYSTPEEVLGLPMEALQNWLRDEAKDALPGFNWLGLAELASASALSDLQEGERRLVLAEVSLEALRIARGLDASLEPSAATSEALLRAEIILRLGPGDGCQEPDALWSVVLATLPGEDTRALVSAGPPALASTSRENLLRLRRVKNTLRSVERLLRADVCDPPADVIWWWDRRERLP